MEEFILYPKLLEDSESISWCAVHIGGSGSVDEIYEKVSEALDVTEEILAHPHNSETGNRTEIEYRLAWARTYLKKYGLLENSGRGVWAISQNRANVEEIDPTGQTHHF